MLLLTAFVRHYHPEKGKGVTALCAYPLPHCAVRCCRACMKVLTETPFYHHFHTCPYQLYIACARVIPDVR